MCVWDVLCALLFSVASNLLTVSLHCSSAFSSPEPVRWFFVLVELRATVMSIVIVNINVVMPDRLY